MHTECSCSGLHFPIKAFKFYSWLQNYQHFICFLSLQPFAKRLALPNSESKQLNVNPSLGLCHFSKLKAAGNLFGRFIAYKRPQSVPWKMFLTKRLVGSSLSVWR